MTVELPDNDLPTFSTIDCATVADTVGKMLTSCRAVIQQHIDAELKPTWVSFITPLEKLDHDFENWWSPISHLHSVCNSKTLRESYDQAISIITEYESELGQNKGLFNAYCYIAEHEKNLHPGQQQTLKLALREFRLSGVDLPPAQQQRFREIANQSAQLSTLFSNNVLDATDHWTYHVTDKVMITGLPMGAKQNAQAKAKAQNREGYLLTLDYPCYSAVMTYCHRADLREKLYHAHVTRASDRGPDAGKWDNSQVIADILRLKHERSQLLGFDNYAQLSLSRKMAESPAQVLDFLYDLNARHQQQAKQEYATLVQFAGEEFGVATLQPWDVAFYSEKLKMEQFDVSEEACRPYFPIEKVLSGLFAVTNRLYGVSIVAIEKFDSWHPDVKLFAVLDSGKPRAYFYLDLYARKQKNGGAWMGECRSRWWRDDKTLQPPVAYLTCNFEPGMDDEPALLTHNDVVTLFHEFGHGLHHMLTKSDYPSVAGINGVPWDAVELPSQFFENWCWQPEALNLISGHYETGEPLPPAMLANLLAAKNFQSALFLNRQLVFAVFDFKLHLANKPEHFTAQYVQQCLDDVRAEIAVVPAPDYNRFQHGFSHIFGGGYAAGYYSYLWAEVLAADAFSRFEEEGIFNPQTGKDFLTHILERGGEADPLTLFRAFRGRAPQIDAFLRHHDIHA